MLILFFIFIFHFLVGQLIELVNNKFLSSAWNLILICAVLYFTLGVEDTADTFMYQYFYENDWDTIDPMFIILGKIMNAYHYDYFAFYKLHIIIYTAAYFFFITRFTQNYFYVFLVFFVLYYVPYVNQIRYYLGFPFYLISIYYFLKNRNLVLFIIFTILALLSHSAIILLYGFIPLYYFFSTKRYFQIILALSGFSFIVVMILFQMGIVQEIEHFGEYFSKGMTSTFAGGVFTAIPYFIYIFYLYIIDFFYKKKNSDYLEDKTYSFLSKWSYFTIIFIPASFFVNVLGQRYVFPFVIVWIIFFLFMIKNETPRKKFFHLLSFSGVNLFVAFLIYILPHSIFGESFYEDELLRSLKSIEYLHFL